MHTGRKILNLRCDRKVSQQDLARACSITASALSKIEAGINAPRANILWKIARNLGVTVEYLLDEEIPYPHPSHCYRQEFLSQDQDPNANVRMDVTREERAFLSALRETGDVAREIAYAIPEVPVERIRLMHFLLNHSSVENPTQRFLKSFESLLTTGGVETPEPSTRRAPESSRNRTSSKNGSGEKSRDKSSGKKSKKKRVSRRA